MLRRHAQPRVLLLMAGDLVATALALTGAYLLYFESGAFPLTKKWLAPRYIEAFPRALVLCMATYAVMGCYRMSGTRRSGPANLRSVVAVVLPASLLLAAYVLYFRDRYQFSRGMLLLFPALAVPLVFLARRTSLAVLEALYRRGIGASRAIIVGAAEAGRELARTLESRPELGIRLVAKVGTDEDLHNAVETHRADQVFLAIPGTEREELDRQTFLLSHEMVDVSVLPDIGRPAVVNPEVLILGGLPVVTLQQTRFYGLLRVQKRLFDLVVGIALLAVILPVGVLIGLLVLLTSGRPVFYSQERMGLDGRRFRILKFRTMKPGAEEDTGAVWARHGDPRCTPVGAVLRRFSLDELPQIGNILKGDMSLVGPRPERPVFIEEFRKELPGYMLRHRMPAGLTGLAQVRGFRGDTDLEERLRCDLEYFERWSVLFDIEIILRTLWRVLLGK